MEYFNIVLKTNKASKCVSCMLVLAFRTVFAQDFCGTF